LGYDKVDLLGFSLGGFISQEIMLQEPSLVRKAILAGTGPAGGKGIKDVQKLTYRYIFKSLYTFKDAKTFMFFNRNASGKKAAKEFLSRLKERRENRDEKMKISNFKLQLKAITAWGEQTPEDLSAIKQPVLIVNGDNDIMVPIGNSIDLSKRIPDSKIITYKDAGHGGIFQYHETFVKDVLKFLQ
jgi:pimeloyl-ACP methyl ester carboxylesterase